MRSNSGKDEARNNLRDPTLRDHDKNRDKPAARAPEGETMTTGLGSNERKDNQR